MNEELSITDELFGTIKVGPHKIKVIVMFTDGTEKASMAIWETIKGCYELGVTPQKTVSDVYLHALYQKYESIKQ